MNQSNRHNRTKSKSKHSARTWLEWLRNFYAVFSLLWIGSILAYLYGYWDFLHENGGKISFWQLIIFVFLIIVPLFAIWGPYYLVIKTKSEPSQPHSTDKGENIQELAHISQEMDEVKSMLSEMRTTQTQLATDLFPYIGVKLAGKLKHQNARKRLSDSDPALPLASNTHSADDIGLEDLTHVLNFSDRNQQGDWANAFAHISRDNKYLEFVRNAENIIETFEQEGIYVEDISLRPAAADIWRGFAKGERGDKVEDLAGMRDPSMLAIIRGRLRNDPTFQDLALRYQKRFMEILENLAPDADDEDLIALNQSRGGRAFVILAHLSGSFK